MLVRVGSNPRLGELGCSDVLVKEAHMLISVRERVFFKIVLSYSMDDLANIAN